MRTLEIGMSRGPSEPSGRDGLDLRCIFIPDGYQGPRPSHAFGHDTLELRCIFIPDEYDGPRPGYPWIEFGRMTLDPASGGAPTAGDRRSGHGEPKPPSAGRGNCRPSPGLAAGRTDDRAPAVAGACLLSANSATNGSPDVTATMALWNTLSDPRAILAAADPRAILAGLDSLNATGPSELISAGVIAETQEGNPSAGFPRTGHQL